MSTPRKPREPRPEEPRPYVLHLHEKTWARLDALGPLYPEGIIRTKRDVIIEELIHVGLAVEEARLAARAGGAS